MVNLIIGRKGSGKTKKLLELVSSALATTKGNVVVIAKDDALKYDVKYPARLINLEEYSIDNYDAMYGFLAGLAAGNYDITDIFVDGILRACGRDTAVLGAMLDKIAKLNIDAKLTLTISADADDLDSSVKKYL